MPRPLLCQPTGIICVAVAYHCQHPLAGATSSITPPTARLLCFFVSRAVQCPHTYCNTNVHTIIATMPRASLTCTKSANLRSPEKRGLCDAAKQRGNINSFLFCGYASLPSRPSPHEDSRRSVRARARVSQPSILQTTACSNTPVRHLMTSRDAPRLYSSPHHHAAAFQNSLHPRSDPAV